MANTKQISSTGIAQQSGLDVFSSVITYTGEYINWGNALAYGTQLTSDTDYATTAANPHHDALINSPASTIGRWYRYHTSGSPYTSVNAPTSAASFYLFNGQETGGLPSYSGIYQKLSLIAGNEYQVEIQTAINAIAGTMYVKTYAPVATNFVEISTATITFPVSNTSTGISTSTFTAQTPNDVIQIYFTTTETSSVNATVTNISIKEKQEYLVSTYAADKWGNDHKILRRVEGTKA